jgi:Protein of unknown function (DUF3105)
MAQRKSAPPGKPATAKGPGGVAKGSPVRKVPAGAKTAPERKAPPAGRAPGSRPPGRPGKSIVNQKQTPWGLIITAIVVVAFAAAVVVAVVVTHKSGTSSGANTASSKGGQAVDKNDPYRQPELAAAAAIKGVTYRVEGQHNHVADRVTYDSTPPVGGNHSGYWADCSGTVYAQPIANENAVHMLEHGAVWITYNAKTVPAGQLATLKSYVSGVDRMALSPYPDLKAPISLQSWGYQLFVNNASDPRIAQFIATLKYNQKTTPEYGATCSQPTFKQHPSTFGNPLSGPASGGAGNTMP